MSTVDLGQYAQWYNLATPEQMMELTGVDPYDEDVQSVLDSYGLNYIGWAVAKDEYFDTLMDDGLEYCLVAQDPETQEIDLYEWVGERLYPAIDGIMSIDFDGYEDEDMIYECANMQDMLKEAFSLQEALINPEDVEYMDDMELEEFLQDNLNDAEQEVLGKLGLYLEPNGSGSMGTFIIYDNNSNELAEISFEDYTDNELNIAYECNTIKQYQKKYTSWIKTLVPKKKKKKYDWICLCPEANPAPGTVDKSTLPLRVPIIYKPTKDFVINEFRSDKPTLLTWTSFHAGLFFLKSWQQDLKKAIDKYFPGEYSIEDFCPDPYYYYIVEGIGYRPEGNKFVKVGPEDSLPDNGIKASYIYIDKEELITSQALWAKEFRTFLEALQEAFDLEEGKRVSRTKNVYTVIDAMDWNKPTFMDPSANGYRCKWGGHNFFWRSDGELTEKEVQGILKEIENRTGIKCLINRGGYLVIPYYQE